MPENNCEQKKKLLAVISLKMACGSKMKMKEYGNCKVAAPYIYGRK